MQKWLAPAALITVLLTTVAAQSWESLRAQPANGTAAAAEAEDPFSTAAAARHRACQLTNWRALVMR